MALRVKRGLADPGGPGAYAKDGVYLSGWRRVRAWLADGGDIGLLYVGKVGLEHPVADWLARGWVRTGPVPKLWDGVGGALARGLLRAEAPAKPVALRVAR